MIGLPIPPLLLNNTDRPLVLFPVRLETHFYTVNTAKELRVRVYPDTVHVDTHEPDLTQEEVLWGNHFHEALRLATTDETKRKAAWQQLADRFGATRAAWIAAQPAPLTPTTKTESWTRAPHTKILPDFWLAIAYVSDGGSGHVVAGIKQGNPVPAKLAVGPNPQAPALTPEKQRMVNAGTGLPIDEEMEWIVNFEAAEKVGMGLRIQLLPFVTDRIDRLLVFGVKKALDASQSAQALQEILTAHQYTNGLGFLAQGTPTNNTPELSSGFSSSDPGHERSFQWALGNQPSVNESNSEQLEKAFGLPTSSFARVAQAGSLEQANARQMNTALWAATWGYFLEQMMMGYWPTESEANINTLRARSHFINFVRAGGPLPTLRIGKQPYGVLPVTSLNSWKPIPADGLLGSTDAGLVNFLKWLRTFWLTISREPDVPRLGRFDITEDLPQVLQTDGISARYNVRNLVGNNYLKTIWSLTSHDSHQEWWNRQKTLALEAWKSWPKFEQLKVTPPVLTSAIYDEATVAVDAARLPMVQADEGNALAPNFIEQLLQADTLKTVRDESFTPKPNSLLYLLLRHAMLLEYAAAATRKLNGTPHGFREPELVGIYPNGPKTVWERCHEAGLTESTKLAMWIETLGPAGPLNIARQHLSEFRAALEHLKNVPPDVLSRLMRGTLDLSSHRLDAWITSFATKRLKTMRQSNATGVYLGGYGWVENLKMVQRDPIHFVPAPAGETGTVFRPPDNPGYVQAPSLDQAATVAVLRNGHLTHSTPNKRELLAIDLSSERVRLAEALLSGIRAGQPLGAVLGYRFERAIHENYPGLGLDKYLKALRSLVPFRAAQIEATDQATESVVSKHLVDGLKLYQQRATILPKIQITNPQDAAAINAEVNKLGEALDALSDALVAESIYHIVRGNPTRAAATLEALERGEAPPPKLEVVKTPRSGQANTYREVVLFTGVPVSPDGWATHPHFAFRAVAEPHLNGWAGRLLGRPERVRITVERIEPSTKQVAESREIRLHQLQLCPLDFIYASDGSGLSELEQRVFYFLRRQPNGFAEDSILRLNPNRKTSWVAQDICVNEFIELCRTARRLLTGARALQANDLTPALVNDHSVINLNELQLRSQRAFESFRAVLVTIQNWLANPMLDKLDVLRKALIQMSHFGLPGALPVLAAAKTEEALQQLRVQAASIEKEASERMIRLDEIRRGLQVAGLTDQARYDLCLSRLRIIFGDAFIILPQFTMPDAAELGSALAASTNVQGGDAMAVVRWQQQAAQIREGIARFAAVMRYAEALQTGDALNLMVAQLPHQATDRWVALPPTTGQRPVGGKLSLIIHAPGKLDTAQPLAGLFIDEWIELIPNEKETTGVTFQYNQPDATAPHAILLVAPPDPVGQPTWTSEALQQVLLETMDLVRMRAVGPEALTEFGQYLPALHFAMNLAGETVATDFLRQTE